MPDMIQDLSNQGIKINSYSIGNYKTTCPRCSRQRKNKADRCLSVTITEANVAIYNCHHCFWKGCAGDVKKGPVETKPKEYVKPSLPKESSNGMPQNVIDYLKGRGITREVWERNKIYYNPDRKAICFPYYYEKEVLNIKSRIQPKGFFLEKGSKLIFYGLDDIKGKDTIIIVEGEFDKLALEVCGFQNVISVPNGAPARIKEGDIDNSGQFEYLQHAEEIFKNVKKVILATDNDVAGKNLQFELARRIGPEKCYIVEFPEKDANDCLKELGVDTVIDCINSAKAYPINGLYRVHDFQKNLLDYFNNQMTRGCSTGYSNLDQYYSVPPGRLTVVTGIPGMGKSELLDAIMWNLSKGDNWNHAIFSPEHGKEAHVTKLIEKVIEVSTDPKSKNRMTEAQFIDGACVISKYFHFIVAEDFEAAPTLDWILDKARAAVFRYGIKGFVIDPYNEIEHVRAAGDTETDYISKLLSRLKKFAKTYGIHIWIVAHPTKIMKDKEGKYLVPSMYDISGSSNWANKADFGLVVHRSETIASVTEVHIKKVKFKHEGKTGQCNLVYNRENGTYKVPDSAKVKNLQFDEQDEIVFDA